MPRSEETARTVHLHVENIGGISTTDVDLSPGVNVLSGENATNRTSFLRAIMAGLGSDNTSLKADAAEGMVELSIGPETYTRHLERTNGRVTISGDPYLDDPELADLFAFLLEENEARQAVARSGADLRSVIMEPIDTTAIQAEIQQYEAKKRQLDERLADLDSLEDRLPGLQEDVTRLDGEIEDKTEALDAVREDIAAAETDLEETRQVKDDLESKLAAVKDVRTERESVADRLETERESLSALREERETLEDELQELPESVEDEREEIDTQLSRLRSRKSTLESEVSELQNLIQFNEDLLSGDVTLLSELRADAGDDVTAQLVEQEPISCWTCGSEVERNQIEGTLDRLREMREEKLGGIADLEAEIEELTDRKRNLDDREAERRRAERRLADVEREIDDREETIDDLVASLDDLEAEIEDLEAEIEALEFAEDHSELLELHQEANRLELERSRLEDKRTDLEDEIRELEERLERRDEIEAERAEVAEALTDLRTRIERIEKEAVAEFNDRIEEILEIMEYGNIARIWIERTGGDDSRSASDPDVDFALHVVRSDESGTAYEDTVDHLSESEREVTGLVFALAGYLVHEVYEQVPFMLLDSVEALDSSRIARLVEYFETEAEYLVIALLEDDARALDDRYSRIDEI